MKLLLPLLFIFIHHHVARSQEISISTDFLTSVSVTVNEEQVPNYLIRTIYEDALEKGISPEAIDQLFQLNLVNLNTAENTVEALNIPYNQVFSLNGFNHTLEELGWTFTNFYNSLVAHLSLPGEGLISALETLGIDPARFSIGIAFGVPDPWTEFIQGQFTQTTMESACANVGISLETLWGGIRDLLRNSVLTLDIENLLQILNTHGIHQQQALVIWNSFGITQAHARSLPLFNEILVNLTNQIQSQPIAGVITGPQDVIIHRDSHDMFNDIREFLNIQAQTVVSGVNLNIGNIEEEIYDKFVVLVPEGVTGELTTIGITTQHEDLINCTYVSYVNNNPLTIFVASAIFVDNTYLIPTSLTTTVVPGSALVCGDTLHGIVRGTAENSIVVDIFSVYVDPSSATSLLTSKLSALGLFLVFSFKYFLF